MHHVHPGLIPALPAPVAATYGDGTHVASITVDSWGRITSASSVAISGAAPSGAAGGDLTGTYPNPTLAYGTTGTGGPLVRSSQPAIDSPTISDAGIVQAANGDTALLMPRKTNTSPTGYFVRMTDALGSADLFAVDVTGSLAAGTVPVARLSGTVAAGNMPALTGDVQTTAGTVATSIGAAKVLSSHLSADAVLGVGSLTRQDVPYASPFMRTLLDDPDAASARTTLGAGTGSGTVTTVSVATANGVSGSVANATTTPAITLTLGAITPTSVAASGTVTGSNLSGTNTGDQTITLTGDVTGSGTGSFAATIGAAKVLSSHLSADALLAANAFGRRPDPLVDLSSPLVLGSLSGSRVSGAVATATSLATPRTINGVSFDGTANVTVTAAAGTLTGATLAANVLASSLTSVGTLTGGATGAGFTVALTTSTVTGTLPAANMPALTGDVTTSAGAVATTIGTAKVLSSMLSADAQLSCGAFGRHPENQPIWLNSPCLVGTLPNAKLANSAVTVTAGTNLMGGGSVSLGSSVTLNAPTMVASGASHAAGAVPDPGATAYSNTQRALMDSAAFAVIKGQFLGYNFVATDQSTTGTSYADLTTADSVSFTLDVAGDVLVMYVSNQYNATNLGTNADEVFLDGSGQASSESAHSVFSANQTSWTMVYKLSSVAAGAHTVKVQHKTITGQTGHWVNRTLVCYLVG